MQIISFTTKSTIIVLVSYTKKINFSDFSKALVSTYKSNRFFNDKSRAVIGITFEHSFL